MTPYVQEDAERYPDRNLANVITWFTSRGYAVAQHHVRGTGNSGGCLEQTADLQIDDGARIVEYLGRDAPWSNGAVGMYGHSYDAETQISTAGLGDPAKIAYLKAIVPSASVSGQYEYSHLDGVPFAGQALLSNTTYLATTSLAPGEAPVGAQTFERFGCQPELFAGSAGTSGDHTAFWKRREYRPGAPRIGAAVLWAHGLADFNVQPIALSGFFDRLPATTPHTGVFGQWEHNYPDKHAGVRPEWARGDWLPMVTAWYDRYLKGLDSGVEDWPQVQVQGTDGQWRAEAGFPQTGGPAGQLALGPDGALGVASPTGASGFFEGLDDDGAVPSTRVVFETPKLRAPLELAGQPVLDAWLSSDQPDAHVTAKLQVLGPDGEVLEQTGSSAQEIGTYGARSLRHLDPIPDGFFQQSEGRPAPVNEPVRVPIRFQPTDIVVPAGGSLRLTVAGATAWARQTVPSGNNALIGLLHDCAHPSALRFLTPYADAPQLNVRETDEQGALAGGAAPPRAVDGGGLAGAPVCGRAPERLDGFGPPQRAGTVGGAVASAAFGPVPAGTPAPIVSVARAAGRRLAVAVDRRRRSRAVRRGLRLRVRCSGGCRLRFRAYRGRRLVGRARDVRAGAGRVTRVLRFIRARRRGLLRGRAVNVRIVVTAFDAQKRPLRAVVPIRLR
jgi:predicted acyl esterase